MHDFNVQPTYWWPGHIPRILKKVNFVKYTRIMADKGAFTVANTRAGRIVFRVHFILYPSKDLGSNNGFRFSSGYPYIDMSHFCYG